MKKLSLLKGYVVDILLLLFRTVKNLHFAQDLRRVTKTCTKVENEKFYSFSFNIPVKKWYPELSTIKRGVIRLGE